MDEHGPWTALEIVEQRSDGKWYTTRRSADPNEWPGMRIWVRANAGRYQLRLTTLLAPYLSASFDPQLQQDAARTERHPMMTEDKARGNGYRLATALCEAFVINPTASDGAWYALARSFAAMSDDYDGRDESDALIDGFREGWKAARPKLLESGTQRIQGAQQ